MLHLREQGRTLVLITHFVEDALRVCDRVTILKNARRVATLDSKGVTKQDVIRMMVGPEAKVLEQSYMEGRSSLRKSAAGPVALEAQHLTKRGAFEDISFQVHQGEILGIYGFMGAGAPELAKCLFGHGRFDSGVMLLGGQPVRFRNPAEAKRAGLAFVPENRRTALHLRDAVYMNISLAHLDRMIGWFLQPKLELEVARKQMQRLAIRPANPFLPVGNLSGGNQQKVVLAKWLLTEPHILILDEPTRGIDIGAKSEVHHLIGDLARQGKAILMISSEMPEILAMSDRIVVMREGRINGRFERKNATAESIIAAATGQTISEVN
jgi:ribose transport system ATP-binding protein